METAILSVVACSSVPQSCYGRDKCFAKGHVGCYTYSWQMTLRPNFRSAPIFLQLRRSLNVLHEVSVSSCSWVYNSRLWSFWHFEHSGLTDVLKSPTPSVHCNLHLEFPTVLRRKSILILFSDVGVCFTVGLLVTSDTVRYSDCSLDATWTWGNNGGQVGTNTRQYTTSSAVRCASSCIRKSWFVNFKWSVTAQWAVRYCSKSRNCTDVCGGILYTYYTV